ncbi:stage II sporulation protein M [Myroides sp. LJL119]
MREVSFIKTNKEQWAAYEKVIYNNIPESADYLALMYIQIMNDLSYAQTFYPNSKVTQYLNNLAGQTYQKIYKTRRIEENRILYFFKTEVPLLIYKYKSYLFFTVILFLSIVAIGVLSAYHDPEFVRLVLGNSYVNTTLDNIEKGDPMAIYQSGSNWGSFILITFNNLYVGLRFFLFGIFAGLGTLIFLLYNGIMLGSFQYFFIAHNSFWESFKGIWLHGAMEITAMVIEAFTGFVLGASILFPKTYSRINSFKISFKDSFKIFIATTPFTIFAGLIEGYLTRYAKIMPNMVNYLIIFITLGVVIYYFFIYPFKVNKKAQQALYNQTLEKNI